MTVAGIPEPRPATKIGADADVSVDPEALRFVGRGGAKLEAAIVEFEIPVTGRTALDIGASTGGFTDCLLQHGAASVVAVDVGTDQLHPELNDDPRVVSLEQVDIRLVAPAEVGAPFDIVVADVAFISLTRLAATIARFGGPATDFVMLVKPQFETGPGARTKRGVVLAAEDRAAALRSVAAAFAEVGLVVAGEMPSPLLGSAGNAEHLLWLRPDGALGHAAGDGGRVGDG